MKSTFILLTLAFVSSCVTVSAATPAKPNVILLMSDDQGWGDVGFNGNDKLHTPHLDAMSAEGIRFDRFYASAPLCSPTRGSCLTGRYPFRFGVLAAHTAGIRVGEITIAEMLKDKGYRTGFFGKWHLGWVKESDAGSRGFYSPPSQHGFDTHFATTSAVPTWNPTMTPADWTSWGYKPGQPWKGGAPYVQDGVEVTHNMAGDDSRVIMDRVIPFIEANRKRPLSPTNCGKCPNACKKLMPNANAVAMVRTIGIEFDGSRRTSCRRCKRFGLAKPRAKADVALADAALCVGTR